MHQLLEYYINAKYKSKENCMCPNCYKSVTKKRQSHIFCKPDCKTTFWNRVRGGPMLRPEYPGGYDQWKKDLRVEEETIASNILLGNEHEL